jgi:RNA polymerase sigma-70 factor (ECF subfamily)
VQAAAIESVYRTHGHSLLRRARSLMGNEDDARELVQEIFTSLLDRPSQFSGASSIATWLYSATTHGCLNRLRNDRTRQRLLQAREAVASEPSSESPEHLAILRQLLARLPEELTEVAVYRYLDGLTQDEIATLLGCSRQRVGTLIVQLHDFVDEEAS